MGILIMYKKLNKEFYNSLPEKICLFGSPERSSLGIPVPQIYSKEDGRYSPRTKRIDILDNISLVFINLGIILSLFIGILVPWLLLGTIPMIVIGVLCAITLYHDIKVEYCRLYEKSLTEIQKQRREAFLAWYYEQRKRIDEIKSKPLSDVTLKDQEFLKNIEEKLSYMEWL